MNENKLQSQVASISSSVGGGRGEVVIIVGSTSGIGRRMAELYAEKGHRVGVTGRRKELLVELQQQFPGQIETECFDVTENDSIERLKSLINKLGGLDILVYSSGVGEVSKELNWELDKMTVDTNVNGFVKIANWAFNYFSDHNKGKLAVISSVAANAGNGWTPAYSASKAFQSNYFEGLQIKARKMKKNISITCIEPGYVNTAMAKGKKFFWMVPVDKAARQIIKAIDNNKKKAYVSKRWWLIAQLMKWAPDWLFQRMN